MNYFRNYLNNCTENVINRIYLIFLNYVNNEYKCITLKIYTKMVKK